MKKLLTIILALLPVLAFSQIKYDSVRVVKPQNFVEALSIDTAIVQIISQKAGVNRRVNFQTVADWILAQQPNLDSAQYANDTLLLFYGADTILAIIPSGTIDTAYLSGDTLGIVFAGDTTEVSLAGISADSTVFATLYALADTASAIRGDFPAPDGNGIYSGSGTVPASTWVEQLGSLIFDIDSLGSFTIGDIDEKNTGAIISVSNAGGNDGQINIRSGSGAGYTNATVVVNNYSMPGTTPSGEGLPTGDYMWIVSQAGVRKGQDSTGWIHIDSLLNGYTTGSGTPGTLPIWSSSTALGNSSLTESGGNVIGTSFTGAFGLATGTTAQAPVGANGLMRYNSTENGISAWNGSAAAWQYLPWASAPAFSANVIPASNGANLVERDIYYNGTNMTVNEAAQTTYNLGVYGTAGARFSPTTSDDSPSVIINTGTTSSTSATLTVRGQFSGHAGISMQDNSIIYFPGSGSYRAESYSNANTAHMRIENDGAGMAVVLDESTVKKPTIASDPAFFVGTFGTTGATVSQNIPLVRYMTGYALGTPSSVSNQTYLQNGYGLYNEFLHSTSTVNHPIAARYGTEVVTVDSATYGAKMWFSSRAGNVLIRGLELYGNDVILTQYGTGARTGTHAYSASFNSAGSLIEIPEKWAAISTSTDGSGDIVVAHGMGVTPTSVQVTVTGTTPYVVTVHTIGSTNFTVRFYDMTGAAVASTAVTATWHAKT